ncbi:PolC-type DNA polymerase III [Erysipelothrix rhusiopathiae]|nr:PolC-type DNA polymerase III [Erysipelothrix rhusiopathiae]MDE8303943.1 PolC-type DNA polymerase III [Erysipelothrix rhusiopathiae]MDE8321079.1 PolC-type DNA polymerase III [Erysipelothrix rhusiopathiae]
MTEIFDKLGINKNYSFHFEDADIISCKYNPEKKKLILNVKVMNALPFSVYRELTKKLKLYTKTDVELIVQSNHCELDFLNISQYTDMIVRANNLSAVKEASLQLVDKQLRLLCIDQHHQEATLRECNALCDALKSLGIDLEVDAEISTGSLEDEVSEMPKIDKVEVVDRKVVSRVPKRRNGKGNYNPIKMSLLTDEARDVSVAGKVFDVEVRETRTGKFIAKYYLSDGESAICVVDFADTEEEIISKGICIRVFGTYVFDAKYERDYIFKMDRYEEIDNIFRRFDTADEKRVEFHLHTKFSEMDGINDASEYMAQAFEWGHPGMIITDHTGVQGFPKAYGNLKKLRSKYPNHEFKLGYGVEMNMVDGELKIVSNAHGESLQTGSYVSFDLETTGLSNYYDHIIEFGGVLIENCRVVKKMQTFIKAPVPVRPFIQELTNITDADLVNAPSIEEAMDEILEFLGDHVLVAHNAQFDIDFIQETLRRIGKEPIQNAVIDTLDLSRALFDNRRSYRLGSIARFMRIGYDEGVAHRADYDAEVLSLVFLEMLRLEQLSTMQTIDDLQSLNNESSFKKLRKSHCTVIAKTQSSIKDLYQLITLSHTKYLAFFGKTSKGDAVMAEPRILRRELERFRENLLIGAGCTNSELFEIAMNKSQEALERCVAFYDYVEIMPLDLYAPLLESQAIESESRLLDIINRIIATATKLNKPILAVGNVHYNHPSEKVIRDVYIHSQGIGGSRHPLYIFNEQRRMAFEAPNQHFRSTNEMLDAFAFLGADKAYEYVVKNPVKLLNEIEDISPKKKELFTPHLENSDELLKDIVYHNAHKLYGNPLPELVQARIERELKSIFGNGYGVIYYISHLLVKKSLDDGYLVGSRGSVGSSLVATMAEITEVNPLAPHYVCDNCHYNEFFLNGEYSSGFDLDPKDCPNCGKALHCEGQDIPFETFLGFEGDKVPDIDLNFSGDYQEFAHAYTKEIFGEEYVYRAGTISTVAQKTAFGYVLGYHESMNITNSNNAWNTYLAIGAEGVKRTTGQHPGGIIVVPDYMDVHDFTPIQYPANNPDSTWYTTHFEFHDIDDNVLKLDILGHVDPTAMKMLERLTGVDIHDVPMNDKKTLSLFGSTEALDVDERKYHEVTGGLGLPEFGTPFVRGMLEATRPNKFSDLVRISGLSHGTDVWRNNAEELIKQGLAFDKVIGCRDDIMVDLMHYGLEAKEAFTIMESVRKGRGLTDEWIASMKRNNVPEWYIDSCLKIKYMFPKAHAVAYVMMAIRVAWFKVYYARAYYAVYFTLRVNAYEIETMCASQEIVASRLNSINMRLKSFDTKKDVTIKEKNLIDTLEVTLELQSRGYKVSPLDLELSKATEFSLDPRDDKAILPPFNVVDGLGDNVARQLVKAREEQPFISKKDLMTRGGISSTSVKKLDELGVTSHLQDSNQMSLF